MINDLVLELIQLIDTSLYDINAISHELGIDMEDMVEIFKVYFIEIRELISELKDLFEKNDWDKLQKTNHNIKGISSNLKIHDIYNTALKLDAIISSGKADKILSCIINLEKMAEYSQLEISDFFKKHGFQI